MEGADPCYRGSDPAMEDPRILRVGISIDVPAGTSEKVTEHI